MSNKAIKVLVYAGLLAVSLFYIWEKKSTLSKDIAFGGDEWEYQSIAVNFALRNQVMIFGGGSNSFSEYCFDSTRCSDFASMKSVFANQSYNTYREPIYPMFLGMWYKAFGFNPLLFKKFQVFLLLIVALVTPLFFYMHYGTSGFYGGVITAIYFLTKYLWVADQIMTEVLISFIFMIYIIVSIMARNFKRSFSFALWGLLSGALILSKGLFVFIPFLFILYYLLTKHHHYRKSILAIVFSLILPLTYSVYSYTQTGKSHFITSQGVDVLLSGNNEYCGDGDWHPEWKNDPTSYYNRNNNTAINVVGFYLHQPHLIIPVLGAKIKSGLNGLIWYQLLFLLSIFSILRRSSINPYLSVVLWLTTIWIVLLYFLNAVFFTTNISNLFSIIALLIIAIWWVALLFNNWDKSKTVLILFVLAISVLFVVIFYSNYRFIMPFEWLIMPFVLQYLSRRILSLSVKRELIIFSFISTAYLIWEGYWYSKVGLAFIKWHTHLMLYFYFALPFLYLIYYSRKALVRNISIAYLSLFVSFGIVELLFLISGINKTYLEKSSGSYFSYYDTKTSSFYHTYPPFINHYITKSEYSFIRNTNSLGFSDIEWSLTKDNRKRVLLLGDSFTEGDGAPQDSSYVSLLSDMLNKDSAKFELMNAGTCGSDPFFNYINYKERLINYKPDIIIQSLSTGDMLTDMATRGGLERFRDRPYLKNNKAPWWEPIYAISYVSRLYFAYLGYNELLIKGEAPKEDIEKYNESLLDLFKRFNQLAIENNTRLIIVIRPDNIKEVIDGNSGYDFTPIKNSLKKESNVEFINLIPVYKNYFKETKEEVKDYYWVEDGHHNSKGYWLMAKSTLSTIFNLN